MIHYIIYYKVFHAEQKNFMLSFTFEVQDLQPLTQLKSKYNVLLSAILKYCVFKNFATYGLNSPYKVVYPIGRLCQSDAIIKTVPKKISALNAPGLIINRTDEIRTVCLLSYQGIWIHSWSTVSCSLVTIRSPRSNHPPPGIRFFQTLWNEQQKYINEN